ncbi:MAG: hypothetical protein N4A70_14010 [Pelagimonas sp.]|jgi:hypothetical protein|nr:hypothetical protein [Pelagimonas sp.]
MTSVKNFFAVTLGVMGAVVLAPFVAFFGLMMLGLTFGLSLIAAGTVTYMAKTAQADAAETPDAAPETRDADAATAQPA